MDGDNFYDELTTKAYETDLFDTDKCWKNERKVTSIPAGDNKEAKYEKHEWVDAFIDEESAEYYSYLTWLFKAMLLLLLTVKFLEYK